MAEMTPGERGGQQNRALKKLDLSLAKASQPPPQDKGSMPGDPDKGKSVLGQISMSAQAEGRPTPAEPGTNDNRPLKKLEMGPGIAPDGAKTDDNSSASAQFVSPVKNAPGSEAPTLISSEAPTLNQHLGDFITSDPSPSSAIAPEDEEIPDLISDRYEVLRVIGRGGMGVVLLAKDLRLQRHVAIKRLIFKSNNMRIVQRRFLREAQTIASLGHVNIVNVYDIGQDERVAYITMEYVAGPELDGAEKFDPAMPVNLDQYIKKNGAMKPEEAEEFMLKLCSAMGYAHKQGTIHRDIKPANILLTDTLEPKIVDFGLARPIEISKTDEITLEGTMLGTPEYSAPEQWGDLKAVSITADIYALGGVFWFLISGRIPRFYRQSDVLPRLGPIITKAMAQKPSDRQQDATELAEEILEARGGAGGAGFRMPESGNSESVSDTQGIPEGMWVCTNCQQFSPDNANYCVHCGASGWQTCQLCAGEIKVGSQFCPNCGEDIKLAEESVAILLSAKNHANFLEYETALGLIKALSKKGNAEAKRLSIEWHEIVLRRRNLLLEFDSALRVFNLTKAVELALELKDLVPAECLSENPDFEVVVKHSELVTDLRRLLVESATSSHEEHNLAKFTQSIQALNQIFGEEVCGAVNSQLSNILSELDQTLTEAGLALGMNCISSAMNIIAQIPPWKGGDLGDRRTRLYHSCKELVEERERSIDDIEASIREQKYSEALGMIRKMGRFRLPPDHSEMDPSPQDMEAHERIMRIDKVLTRTIDENISDWIKCDAWDDIKNSLLVLEQGESRSWQELLKRIKHATKQEIAARHGKAVEMERKGRFSSAARAWEDFRAIPDELLSPQFISDAAEFETRKRLNSIKTTRIKVISGTTFLFLLFFMSSSLLIWLPLFSKQAAWFWLPLDEMGFTRTFFTGNQLDWPTYANSAVIQLVLFSIVAVIARSKWLHRNPRILERFSAPPRMQALGLLAALSPLAMTVYEPYYHWFYMRNEMSFLFHPALLMTVIWVVIDLIRDFKPKRIPANFALTISWIASAGIMHFIEPARSADVARISFLFPKEAKTLELWVWPRTAMLHALIFLLIVVLEHIVYRNRNPEIFKEELKRSDISTGLTDTVTRTSSSIDFKA